MAQPEKGSERRPDPDALLALAGQEGKGRLRVFLGAAPGVGKTYAMLSRARAVKASGHDIVVGLVETHGRSETEALVEGLEVLPRRRIDYRDRTLDEFDLDAALARKPQTILVDELAHTNAPDSRHPKRWLDVEELLGAGVDVWTTLNIQHIESLADVVARITGVAVRETVPDRLLSDAHEVILVDITPDELLERLAQGKVYVSDMAARARQNFFIPRNLIALRELALRRTAERVDDEMVDFLRQSAIEGPWATSERLLALVGPGSSGERLVRTAARLASGLNATWIALYIERAMGESQSAEGVKNVDQTLRLAEMLGAEVERRIADDMVGEALKVAREENITQILVGRSRATFPSRLWRPSLAAELVRRSPNIAVLVQIDEETEPRPQRKKIERADLWQGAAAAVSLVAAAVGVGMLLQRWLPPINFASIFLLPVLICAARFGLWPAIAAALLSFLAEDYFFIEPLYSITISEPHEFITLIVSLIVAVVTGMLASRLRDHSRAMRQRVQSAQSLFEFSRKVAGAGELDGRLMVGGHPCAEDAGDKERCLSHSGRGRSRHSRLVAPDRSARSGRDHRGALGFRKERAGGMAHRHAAQCALSVSPARDEPRRGRRRRRRAAPPRGALRRAAGAHAHGDIGTSGHSDRSIAARQGVGENRSARGKRKVAHDAPRFALSRSAHAARLDHRRGHEPAAARRQDGRGRSR